MTGAAELWTLSRVIAAGEALAPAAREGAASPGASTQVRGPLVAIVTHRERL